MPASIFSFMFVLPVVLFGAGVWCVFYLHHMKQVTEMLSGAMQAAGHGVIFFNKRGKLRRFNAQAAQFFPCLEGGAETAKTYDAFLGAVFERAVPSDASLQQFLEERHIDAPRHGFREIIRWDNENWSKKQYCLVEAQRADNNCAIIILSDISDALQGQENFERLNDANNRLAEAIQATDSGILLSDPRLPNNPITFVNKAFCELTDTPDVDVVCDGWGVLSEVFEESLELDELHKAVCLAKPMNTELRIAGKGGDAWFNVKLNVLRDDGGAPHMMVAILTETTVLKNREQQFFKVQKLESLGQLSAGVAHDFNNILSIICGYAQFANKPDIGCDQSRDYFERIAAAAQRGSALTQKLMMFTRHKTDVREVHDLGALIREQGALLSPLLDSKTSLTYALPDAPIYVAMTTDSLSQILMNIVINARDAMGQNGGTIHVSLGAVQSHEEGVDLPERLAGQDLVCLSIADDGQGMPKEVVAKIFDPFFTTKDVDKGTGLGLSMVYGLIKDMGGHIHTRSVPGQGTTFSIYFVRSDEAPSKMVSGDIEDISSIRFDGYTALVVDDEADLLALCSDMLEGHGMNVLKANNGNEALAVQDDHVGKIDLLLSDIVMPDLDGLKLAQMFKELRPETQVVHMSGYPVKRHEETMAVPEDTILFSKPLDHTAMIKAIYGVLRGDVDGGEVAMPVPVPVPPLGEASESLRVAS